MHSSGWIYSMIVCANSGSSFRGWMQSTGQTSTQAVSFVSMHGSVMMNGMLACLRQKVASGSAVGPRVSAIWPKADGLYPDQREKHHGRRRHLVAHRLVQRLSVAAGVERDREHAVRAAPGVEHVHEQPGHALTAV